MSKSDPNAPKRLALISSKGTLDWAYPPFILATAAGAMGWEVGIFFTFSGLTLLKPKLTAAVSPLGNPAMPMKMPFGPEGFQNINWPMPNLLMANVPGFETVATNLMKQTFKNKGVASDRGIARHGDRTGCAPDRLPDDHGRLRLQAGGFHPAGGDRRRGNLP
jgi:peroxiredoxin family protein